MTGLTLDPRFEQHLTGAEHPERPQRLEAVAAALREAGLIDRCKAIEAREADLAAVLAIHDETYVERLHQACIEGATYIDVPDSAICPASYQIALLAAGAAIAAVDQVMAGAVHNAFCAVRPPGHHAECDRSMGFCLFNSIAVAAQHLIDQHGLSRVLILDWDVHHGNGTQHIFETDPRVLFISIHGHPGVVYPGTGHASERGSGPGEGFTLNYPMLPPSGDEQYRRLFDNHILPAVYDFAPEFILLSAGFDAHQLDPLAPLALSTEVFGWMTDQIMDVAKRHCDGRLVSLLEGGYHLTALADCAVLHVERLLDD